MTNNAARYISVLLHTLLWCSSFVACRSELDNEPYGYAPYVWISISVCNPHDNWCMASSLSGFALTLDYRNRTTEQCTHYCPGKIFAYWRPVSMNRANMGQHKAEGLALGAYVKRIDRNSCREVPGGFKCSERVVMDTPLNNVSIELYAHPHNRNYFFGPDPMADCEPDPQCAAYKFLRQTLLASPEDRKWPDTDQVLSIRNSPYACVLSYAGLGDIDSIGTCYAQFGDRCFSSEGNRFCIGNSREARVGLTNADNDASAPIAICEVSEYTSRGDDDVERPTAREIRQFLVPSSCDATLLSLDRFVYDASNRYLSVGLNVSTFHIISEVGHVILRVPFDECVIPIIPGKEAYSTVVDVVAETLSKVMLSTYSTGILLDTTNWGNPEKRTECPAGISVASTEFTKIVHDVASALVKHGVPKLFLRLPRAHATLNGANLSKLRMFDTFITHQGIVDMTRDGHCQNMWVDPHSRGDGSVHDPSGEAGIVPFLLSLLKSGIRGNRIMFTLSLTGGVKISAVDKNPAWTADIIDKLSLADMETNTMLRCEEDLNTKCCSGSMVTVWQRNLMVNVTVTSTSFETLKRFPELIADAFGINQFVITPVNSDFKRGIRPDTPAILGITSAIHRLRDRNKQQRKVTAAGQNRATFGLNHGMRHGPALHRSRRATNDLVPVEQQRITSYITEDYRDPASGSKNVLDPHYNFGLSNTVVCPGLLVFHGALGIFKEPYKEFYSTRYEKIYLANLHKLYSCTPGEPNKKAIESNEPPQLAININTLVPSTDPKHYTVGILNSEHLVVYIPPVNKMCVEYNTGDTVHNMKFAAIDNQYTFDQPVVRYDQGVIMKPSEIVYFVSNFTLGVDYINLNVSCVDYDVSALQPCLIAICGADEGCRKDYGRLCNSAHEIINDARRAGALMREGLQELASQEHKAKMYQQPDDYAPFPGINSRSKRFVGAAMGAAALAAAMYVAHRVNVIEKQMDLFQNTFMDVSNQMVEVSRKLDKNIALVNTRLDEHEHKVRHNNEVITRNVQLLKDAILRNTEAAMRDTNVKFSVLSSYQMWYAQMQSITHQLTQAAMHTKFMARGVENCLRQIAVKRSGSCPSGLQVMQNHPGLADFPTVAGALYKSRKLFIVHSVPGHVEKTIVRGIIPMPNISTDGVPCWPDYKVWVIGEHYYEQTECHGRYCHKAQSHEKYMKCLSDFKECKTVCGKCHRGICYENGKFTWRQGTATIEVESPPLRPFPRPRIMDGPITFAGLLKDAIPDVPELELLQAINTSVKLIDVREDLNNITRTLQEFDKQYNDLKAQRLSFGGWLSGMFSGLFGNFYQWLVLIWCSVLTLGLVYVYKKRNTGAGFLCEPVKRRSKML